MLELLKIDTHIEDILMNSLEKRISSKEALTLMKTTGRELQALLITADIRREQYCWEQCNVHKELEY